MTATNSKDKKPKSPAGKTGSGGRRPAPPSLTCPRCGVENPSESRFCSDCAAPLKEKTEPVASSRTVRISTDELARGNRLADRYEILEELGKGGMGRVFKVFDHKIGETIALKLIRPEISVQEKAIERFKNELKCARKITHRNICRMYDLGEADFLYYITMEYIAGEDLKRFIKRAGALGPGKAIFLAKQICEGLAEAHRLGAIHRDLKPQNIMIDQEGNAKIMDFGIARFTDVDRVTGSGVMIGTPEYMSPEQVDLKDIDQRADLYSLGIVLYEMVTAKIPFEGGTVFSLAMKHKTEKPRDVREWNPQIPADLADVISKCLEKEPGSRFQTAEEMLAALNAVERNLETGERVMAKKPGPAPTRKPAPSFLGKPAVLIGAVAVVVAVAAFAIISFVGKKTAGPPSGPEAGQAQAVPAESKPERRPSVTGFEPTVPAAPAKKEAAAPAPKTTATQPAGLKPEVTSAEKPKPEAAPAGPPPRTDAFEENKALDLAKARLAAAKSASARAGFDEKSIFFGAALDQEKLGQSEIPRRKIVDARCAYTVAEKLYRICVDRKNDADRLKALSRYVDDLRDGLKTLAPGTAEVKLFAEARDAERDGEAYQDKKDFENAVKSFARAALGYEKIRWVRLSAIQK
jgi:predicted Ser/Thr protein kinase